MKKSLNVGLFIVACAVSGSVYAGDLEDQLLEGAQFGDVEKVRRSLELGADPNIQNNGSTPLSLAVISGWAPIVEMLLKKGANPNTIYYDSPVLNIAVTRSEPNYVQMVKTLLQHGADPLIEDSKRRTPFDNARSAYVRRLLSEALERRMEKSTAAVMAIKEKYGEGYMPPEMLQEIAKEVRKNP